MPRISEFFGITIYLYYDDHAPPHFHAFYQGQEGVFSIQTLALVSGQMSPRVRALIVEWAAQHQAELMHSWTQAQTGQPPDRIAPLE